LQKIFPQEEMMMKAWLNENLLTTWIEAQRRFHEGLSAVLPTTHQVPAGMEWWWEAYLKHLTTWEAAVKKTLQTETAWVEQWAAGRTAGEQATVPEILSTWTRQMEGLLRQWLSLQNQLWDEFFALLRQGGTALNAPSFATAAAAALEPADRETAPVEPATAITPSAPAAPSPEPDDLKMISGIGPATEKKLHTAGVVSYQQIATLSNEEIERIETAIKWPGRIRRDHWIEQARELHWQKYQEKG
jgi:predicted flap endonuclease-1-like 5' DNA nuclease